MADSNQGITPYHAKYFAWELTRRRAASEDDRLSQSLFDASVDLNPHQIDAALFALNNPLSKGVVLADEVGLGKTIEAALVQCQLWAERRRRQLEPQPPWRSDLPYNALPGLPPSWSWKARPCSRPASPPVPRWPS